MQENASDLHQTGATHPSFSSRPPRRPRSSPARNPSKTPTNTNQPSPRLTLLLTLLSHLAGAIAVTPRPGRDPALCSRCASSASTTESSATSPPPPPKSPARFRPSLSPSRTSTTSRRCRRARMRSGRHARRYYPRVRRAIGASERDAVRAVAPRAARAELTFGASSGPPSTAEARSSSHAASASTVPNDERTRTSM